MGHSEFIASLQLPDKTRRVLAYMIKRGSIDDAEANLHLGITRLSDRIYALRVIGCDISTKMEKPSLFASLKSRYYLCVGGPRKRVTG